MIEVIPEWNLTAKDDARIAEILRQSFPTDYAGRSFYQQRPHLRVVWREEEILAQLSLFLRAIRLGDDMVDVFGIGDVATAPQTRGRGFASALMAHSNHVAKTSGTRYLILFGNRTLYDRAGFLRASNRFRHTPMTGARTGEVEEGTSPFLRVRCLSNTPWPQDAHVDFLGPLF